MVASKGVGALGALVVLLLLGSAGAIPLHFTAPPSAGTLSGGPRAAPLAGSPAATTIPVRAGPSGVAYDPSNHYTYVADYAAGTVTVISGGKAIANVSVGSEPLFLAPDPSNGWMFVTVYGAGTVVAISGTAVIATVATGLSGPYGIAFVPKNDSVIVTEAQAGNVDEISAIPPYTLTTLNPDQNTPSGIVYDAANGDAYISNSGNATVAVLNMTTSLVLQWVAVAPHPLGLAYDSGNGDVYVAQKGSPDVTLLSGTTVASTVNVSGPTLAVTYDPQNGYVYASLNATSYVAVLSGSTLETFDQIGLGLTAGEGPRGLDYNGVDRGIYVAVNATASYVYVINPSYPGALWFSNQPAHGFGGVTPFTLGANATTNASVNDQCGTPPDFYWTWTYTAPGNCKGQVSTANTSTFTHAYAASSTTSNTSISVSYPLYVGGKPNGTLTITANVLLDSRLYANLSLSANGTYPGTAVTVAVNTSAMGGERPMTYAWSLNGTSYPSGNVSSFAYRPAGAGNYSFRVQVTDHFGQSVAGHTVLAVVPNPLAKPLTANVTLSAYRVQNGTPVTATAIAGNASSPTYAWTLNGTLPLSCTGTTCVVTLVHPATYLVNVTVTDGSRTAWSQAPLTVYNGTVIVPLNGSVALSANGTYPGTPIWINATASGGIGPYSYWWALNGSYYPGTSSSLRFDPHGAGNYTFAVNISDSTSHTIVRGTLLTVLANVTIPTLTASLALSANDSYPGTTVWFNVTTTGGKGTLSYAWTLNGSAYAGTTSSLAVVPAGAGNYSVAVTVSDPYGQTATAGRVLTVLPAPPVNTGLSVTLAVNASKIRAGGSVTLSGTAVGGTSPYGYAWSLNDTNVSALGVTSFLKLTLSHPGNYTLELWVTDANRQVAGSNPITVEVLPATHGTNTLHNSPFSLSTSLWIFLALAILAVALGVGVWRMRRRSPGPEGPAAAETEDVPSEVPPEQPEGYMEGITVAPAEWDESADEDRAYGTYALSQEERSEFIGKIARPSATGVPASELKVDRPWSMKITPEGIHVEEIGPAAATAVAAEEVAPAKEEVPPAAATTPSTSDIYTILGNLAKKPLPLESLQTEVTLGEADLVELLGSLSKARMIASGTSRENGATLFVLTPLGRKIAARHASETGSAAPEPEKEAEAVPAEEAVKPTEETPEAPASRLSDGTTVQDVHRLGEERGSVDEESPFQDLKPEDVNPQLKGAKPLPKEVLQPMEMRVQGDRGAEARPSTETGDSDSRAKELMERADRERTEKQDRKKRKGKFGVEQAPKPADEPPAKKED